MSNNIYDNYVIRPILALNKEGITEVQNLKTVADLLFTAEIYRLARELITSSQLEELKSLASLEESSPGSFREFLHIFTFNDQNKQLYAVTIYTVTNYGKTLR